LMRVVQERTRQVVVSPSANLELDLGLDSMERVELLTALEAAQQTTVQSEVRSTVFTVQQLVDAVMAAPRVVTTGDTQSSQDESLPTAAAGWEALLAEPPDPALLEELSRPKWIRAAVLFAIIRVCRWIARVAIGFRVDRRGELPASGPMLLCPNHQSFLDGFFLAAALPFPAFRRLFFVGASEYFETPLMARLARAINIIPVDPDANLVSAMRAGAAGLRAGKVLMLFPEGERSIDGDVRPFRKGAAILAAECRTPIVPVAIDGLYDLWPRGRPFNWANLLPGRGSPVTVIVGTPVMVEAGRYTDGTSALQSAVSALLQDLRSPRMRRSA
jgi:long-chain acyl-CoA synthetase